MSVIGIDVDNTLAKYTEWKGGEYVGEPDEEMAEVLRTLHAEGHCICIWTTRPDYVVSRWLWLNRLLQYVHHINKSPYPTESGKASFDFYIGDDAIRWDNNPEEVLEIISQAKRSDFSRESDFSSHNPLPYLSGVGRAYVDMFEEHWRKAWDRHVQGGRIAFMTICSHAKPYSKSFIHTSIRKHLHEIGKLNEIDYIHISNAGIVPASAEMVYPFNAYDWNGQLCTTEVLAYHKEAISRRFEHWLDQFSHFYDGVIIYLRADGNTHGSVSRVLQVGDYPLATLIGADSGEEHYLPFVAERDVDDCLTSSKNLSLLTEVFRGI